MKRTGLPKAALEHAALVEMRALSGCEGIAEVRVERDPSLGDWKIAGVRNGGEALVTFDDAHRDIARGIFATQKKLRQIYDLRLD